MKDEWGLGPRGTLSVCSSDVKLHSPASCIFQEVRVYSFYGVKREPEGVSSKSPSEFFSAPSRNVTKTTVKGTSEVQTLEEEERNGRGGGGLFPPVFGRGRSRS